ncbi:MAG: hypothetical protein WC958_00360 [Dehalococcoidales bacterium]
MKKGFSIILVLILVISGTLMIGGNVFSASSENKYVEDGTRAFNQALWNEFTKADDVDNFFTGLTTEKQEALIEMLTPVKCESITTVSKARGQKTVYQMTTYKGPLGGTLFEYCMQLEWGYDNVIITEIYDRHSWGNTYWGYQHDALSESESGGVGNIFFKSVNRSEFCLSLGGRVISITKPWIDITVDQNGGYNISTGE